MADEADALDLWKSLVDGRAAALVEEAAQAQPVELATLEKLRTRWEPELITVALELARARRKAHGKFPDADQLVADVSGLEQATSRLVADHKAERYRALAPAAITDLCCGIGGDAMSLARIADLDAVDHSPLRAWMTHQNARCPTRVADVESLRLDGAVFHLDPARRRAPGAPASPGPARAPASRLWRYEDYQPGPAFIARLLQACPTGAIKLGPGVDLTALPDAATSEVEIISEHGTLVQAVLWTGLLARHPGERTATRLPDGLSFTGRPEAGRREDAVGTGTFERYLIQVDPTIERANLTRALCQAWPVRIVQPGLGLLTSAEPIESPWLRCRRVRAQMPWRPKRIKAWLADHDGGTVEVKTRGKAVDTDATQRALRGDGDERWTVFALRLDRRIVAVITPSS